MMVERVAFATGEHFVDEFYLSEEDAEWIGLKKSEYLSRLIENLESDDYQFEEFFRFDDQIPATISAPDWSVDILDDGKVIRTYCRSYQDKETYHQVVVGAVMPNQDKNDVFVPIISFVSRKENLVKLFSAGKVSRPLLN